MRTTLKLRLYVAGDGPNSLLAISNLNALCREHVPNRHSIEIVDVFRDPDRALNDGILLTPTLVKLFPRPVLRVVGTLSANEQLRQALGLPV